MTAVASHLAVGAVVRRGDGIVLVRDEGSEGAGDDPVWALPGGAVEDGEPVLEALLGRVRDETGVSDASAGPLLWVARYVVGGETWETYGFEVLAERGPAGVPVDVAVERLSAMWFAPIREPAVRYLTGHARVATLWVWHRPDQEPRVVPPLLEQ